MKKALILVFCCLIGVLFTACGEDSNKNNNGTGGNNSTNNPSSYNSTISSYPENSTIPSAVDSMVSGAKSDVTSMMSKVESKMQ